MNKEERKVVISTMEVIGIGRELNIDSDDEKIIDLIGDYISVHRWLINEKIDFKIRYEQATFSWYENVYKPIRYVIYKQSLVLKAFPEKAPLEIFSNISDLHYAESKARGTDKYIPYEEICRNYILENSKKWFIKLLTKLFY